MYIKNNLIYSEAYKYLSSDSSIGLTFPIDSTVSDELDVNLDDMELHTSLAGTMNAHCTNGIISFAVKANPDDEPSYAKIKTEIIKSRYSNDDQIAIMLNVDNDDEQSTTNYRRMQEWRSFATDVAKKIMELYDSRGTQTPSGEQQDVEADS